MNDELILLLEDGDGIDLRLELGATGELPPVYDGEYTVTPRLDAEQELLTQNKLMANNVVVHPIPVVITTNPYDGRTVVIG